MIGWVCNDIGRDEASTYLFSVGKLGLILIAVSSGRANNPHTILHALCHRVTSLLGSFLSLFRIVRMGFVNFMFRSKSGRQEEAFAATYFENVWMDI